MGSGKKGGSPDARITDQEKNLYKSPGIRFSSDLSVQRMLLNPGKRKGVRTRKPVPTSDGLLVGVWSQGMDAMRGMGCRTGKGEGR